MCDIIFQLANDIIINYEIVTICISRYGNGLMALQCEILKVFFGATLAIILLQKILLLKEPQD